LASIDARRAGACEERNTAAWSMPSTRVGHKPSPARGEPVTADATVGRANNGRVQRIVGQLGRVKDSIKLHLSS
jgi:hypothetical protein